MNNRWFRNAFFFFTVLLSSAISSGGLASAEDGVTLRERFYCTNGENSANAYDECGIPRDFKYMGYFEVILDPESKVRAIRTCSASKRPDQPCQQQQSAQQPPQNVYKQPTLSEVGKAPWIGEECSWEFTSDLHTFDQQMKEKVEAEVRARFPCDGSMAIEFFLPSK